LIKSYKLLIAGMLVFVAACTTTSFELPSITSSPTGTHLQGKVIWHELLTEDMAAAKHFYGELFGWSFETIGSNNDEVAAANYTMAFRDGNPVAGMIDARLFEDGHENLSQWVSVISVGDVEYTTTEIRKMGGSVLGGPTDLADRGHISAVADTQGALFAVLQTSAGDPLDTDPEVGDFLWDELWTDDVSKATEFYSDLLGYEARSETVEDDSSYKYLAAQGYPRVAIIKNEVEGLDPTWVSYIRVEDVRAVAAKVEGLGGRILLEPRANPIGGELAIVSDPTGAGIVIQTWDKSRVGKWRIQQ
jgi:predicted enzyme related to lactoylglutathione lyase